MTTSLRQIFIAVEKLISSTSPANSDALDDGATQARPKVAVTHAKEERIRVGVHFFQKKLIECAGFSISLLSTSR